MSAHEERLAFLEGRVMEQGKQVDNLRDVIAAMDEKMTRQFMWLVGIHMTSFAILLTAVVARS